MIGPVCECGNRAVLSGHFWICGTPSCDGFGQVCRAARDDEINSVEGALEKRVRETPSWDDVDAALAFRAGRGRPA